MDDVNLEATATLLSRWPTEQVRRVYRLVVRDVHEAVVAGVTADIAASEQEAAMFAQELIRRGELWPVR